MSYHTRVLIIAAATALGLTACSGNDGGEDVVVAPSREPRNPSSEVRLGPPSLAGSSSGGAPVLEWTGSAGAGAAALIDYRVFRTTWNAVVRAYSDQEEVVATLQSTRWTDPSPPYSYAGAPTAA